MLNPFFTPKNYAALQKALVFNSLVSPLFMLVTAMIVSSAVGLNRGGWPIAVVATVAVGLVAAALQHFLLGRTDLTTAADEAELGSLHNKRFTEGTSIGSLPAIAGFLGASFTGNWAPSLVGSLLAVGLALRGRPTARSLAADQRRLTEAGLDVDLEAARLLPVHQPER